VTPRFRTRIVWLALAVFVGIVVIASLR